MKWLDGLFARAEDTPLTVSTVQQSHNTLWKIDQLCIAIFKKHHPCMLREKTDYVVQSVWGCREDETLTEEQQCINKELTPAIEELCSSSQIESTPLPTGITFRVILCNLIIYKLIYMVERYRNIILGSQHRPFIH